MQVPACLYFKRRKKSIQQLSWVLFGSVAPKACGGELLTQSKLGPEGVNIYLPHVCVNYGTVTINDVSHKCGTCGKCPPVFNKRDS